MRQLKKEQNEFILTKQLMRSGTAIGALISEAKYGQSKADFIHKLSIALKEANESSYWLNLLHDTGYLSGDAFSSLSNDCEDLIRLLVSSIKTAKAK